MNKWVLVHIETFTIIMSIVTSWKMFVRDNDVSNCVLFVSLFRTIKDKFIIV